MSADPLEMTGVGVFMNYLWEKFPEHDVSPISFKWSRKPVHEFEVETGSGMCVIEVASSVLRRRPGEIRNLLNQWGLVGAVSQHRRLLVSDTGISPRAS